LDADDDDGGGGAGWRDVLANVADTFSRHAPGAIILRDCVDDSDDDVAPARNHLSRAQRSNNSSYITRRSINDNLAADATSSLARSAATQRTHFEAALTRDGRAVGRPRCFSCSLCCVSAL
jgi:hypothetical protein